VKALDAAELLLLAALWGGSFLFLRIAAPVLGPVWLIDLRVLLAGIALLPLLLNMSAKRADAERLDLNRISLSDEIRANFWPLMIVGALNSAFPFVLLAFASVSLPAGFTSILNATSPLFGALVAALWFRERLTINRLIGLVLGFVGVVILIGWKPFAATPAVVAACVASLAAALMYAIAAPYIKQRLSGISPLIIATLSQLGAAIVLLPAVPFTIPSAVPGPSVILCVILLALFSTSLAYLLYFRLIQNIGPTKALTVTFLVPIFAMLWGALFLKEPITVSMIFGCALILLGTAFANDLIRPKAPGT
jgi:drug/metabolite transporter (DMT)-like permease